jgi:hypothetical protein
VSLALLFLREFFEVLGCPKELRAGFVDPNLLNNGSDLLRLPAILGSLGKSMDGHTWPLHAGGHQPGPFDLD